VSATPRSDFRAVLETLARHRVEFLVVGGIGAVLQGAPLTTFDLDVVHSTGDENVARLLAALKELDAVYRAQPDHQLRTERRHFASAGHQLLITKHGPLDLLGTVGKSRTFESLVGNTVRFELSDDRVVLVLGLESLIQLKEETGRPQDLAVLPVLRRTLKERRWGEE